MAKKLYPDAIWYKDELVYPLTLALADLAHLERDFSESQRLYSDNLRRMQAAQHYLFVPESLEGLAILE
jgi:hypothetical protein